MPSTEPPETAELLRDLRDGGSEARRLAAIALGRRAIRTRGTTRAGTAPAIGPAAEQGLRDGDPVVRREIAYALGQWGGDEAIELLTTLVVGRDGKSDPDPNVRAVAVRALARIGGPQARTALEAAVLEDPAHDVRAAAVTALGSMVEQPAPPSSPMRSRGAVRTRGGVRRRPDPPSLRHLLERVRSEDPSGQVRELAEEALSHAAR